MLFANNYKLAVASKPSRMPDLPTIFATENMPNLVPTQLPVV